MAVPSLIEQLTDCAGNPRNEIQLGGSKISLEIGDWYPPQAPGKPPPGVQQRMISARIGDGSLGDILGALMATFGDSKLEAPGWLTKVASSIVLRHLTAGFGREGGTIDLTALGFGLDVKTGEWVLIEHLLTVSELKADFSVLWPANQKLREIRVSVGGKLTFAGAPIAITATSLVRPGPPPADNLAAILKQEGFLTEDDEKQSPDLFRELSQVKTEPQTRFDFEIEGRLESKELKTPLSLGEVIRHFGWATSGAHDGAPHDDPFDHIEIKALEMRASTADGSFEFLLDLAAHNLNVGATPLELKDLYLHVEGSADRGFGGTLGCDVEFDKNLSVHLQASCDLASGGWIFEGELKLESGERLRDVIQNKFGITLPDIVKDLKPRPNEPALVVDLAFNTSTKEFNFSIRAGLEIGKNNVVATRLEISVSPDDFQVGGAVDLSKRDSNHSLHFGLMFESVGKDKAPTLIGIYTEQGDDTFDLAELAGRLAEVNLGGAVQLRIPGAVFVWQKERVGHPGLNLLAFNIEGGLDLAAIKLPNVPILHDSTAAGISAKLDFQVVLASRLLNDKDEKDAALRAAITAQGFGLTAAPVQKGVNLAAQLRLGDDTHVIAAPAEAQKTVAGPSIANDAKVAPAPAQADDAHWLDLHRKLGPLRFERIGLQFLTDNKPPAVALLLDAGFEFAGLQVSLDGLRMQSPLDHFQPTFGLSGLGISYRSAAVEIGGALLLVENGFEGSVIIKAKKFTLSAMGAFQVVQNQPSLFIYATLDAALGGPPFFYVTGLAAGFGYNRDVLLPEAEQVEGFPLVKRVMGESTKPELPTAVLRDLSGVMPIAIGKGFAAIGVHFTSFKVLDSFALLVAKFGPRFELDLVGISRMVSPPGADANPVAKATLGLRARFVPDEGILAVRAVLGPDSFVLSNACHLGGGFAFSAWFRDLEATSEHDRISGGDFVVTLGGYHTLFVPPKHYPTVPRLSIEWKVNDHLSIKGSAYFALTGTHLMAGGRFEATWLSEDVRVTFLASADFLMSWKPYHYDVRMHISIAADITIHLFGTHHLTFDAGADLHLWGPEFSGTVRLYVHILCFDVSFDAEFGHGATLAEAISEWKVFQDSFLPKVKKAGDKICAIGVRGGLLGTEPAREPGKEAVPIIAAQSLGLAFETPIPLSKMPVWTSGEQEKPAASMPAIASMGLLPGAFESSVKFEFRFGNSPNSGAPLTASPKHRGDGTVELTFGTTLKLLASPIHKSMPAGVWGTPVVKTLEGHRYLEAQPLNSKPTVDNMLVGFEFAAVIEPKQKGKELLGEPTKDEIEVSYISSRSLDPPDARPVRDRRTALLRALGVRPEALAA